MEKNSICRFCIFLHAREIFQHAKDIISMIVYSCALGRREFGSEKGCRFYQKDEGFVDSTKDNVFAESTKDNVFTESTKDNVFVESTKDNAKESEKHGKKS